MIADSFADSSEVWDRYVILLGGSGFIGTRLASVFAAHAIPFRIGDINPSKAYPRNWTRCDVTQPESVCELARGASAIINLAAEHRDNVRPLSRYGEVNVQGAAHVCEGARRAGVKKIIFTSSAAVYGFHSGPVDENGPFEPFNEYGKTKFKAESIYRAWAEENPGRTLVMVRPTVVFGEGNRGNVYNLMHQIEGGKFFMVGPGTNIKSIAYVGNVAAFLEHCLTLGPGVHIANYADGPDMNMNELLTHIQGALGANGSVRKMPANLAMGAAHVLDLVSRVTGRTFPISAIRVRKFCETTRFKADRVAQWGFKPPFTLAEGISGTVKFEFRNK